MHRQFEPFPKFLREALHLLCLYAFLTTHPQGESHDNFGDIVFPDHFTQSLKIQPLVLPMKCR